ncbi:MAG: hypothetical protein M3Q07_26285 [Pseudobdellovibrionaceae bacterium]|nr:hypothetical protein [Pseudobdellovibrionaceae bacterium]
MKKIVPLGALVMSHLASAQSQEERGYQFLVNGNYIGCGVPVTVMKRALTATALIPPPVMAAFFPMATSKIFESSGLRGRNRDNQGVTSSFNVFETPRGVKAMSLNCFSCHGDTINGQYMVGLGNRSRDFTQDLRAFTNFLPLLAWTAAEKQEVALFQQSMNAIAPYIQTRTIGVNPAINLTYALFANRRSQDFTWSDELTLAPPSPDFPPLDVPPWWRLNLKDSMFYNAEFSDNHHRIMTLASTLCIEDAAAMRALEEPFRDVEAYIKTLKAPAYPGRLDAPKAAVGKTICETLCADCHGSYADDGSLNYRARIIPVDKIGTDRALMDQQTGPEHERFRQWGEASFQMLYGDGFHVKKHPGYLAPPLNGIWATAPFLHNGSVPSLEGVLNSRIRPRYWLKLSVGTGQDYDTSAVAVKFKELPYGQRESSALTRRYIYDTTWPGYGNQGHTYGDALTDAERQAVMEFLKSL